MPNGTAFARSDQNMASGRVYLEAACGPRDCPTLFFFNGIALKAKLGCQTVIPFGILDAKPSSHLASWMPNCHPIWHLGCQTVIPFGIWMPNGSSHLASATVFFAAIGASVHQFASTDWPLEPVGNPSGIRPHGVWHPHKLVLSIIYYKYHQRLTHSTVGRSGSRLNEFIHSSFTAKSGFE
jgi:hypothetical protein